MKRRTWILIWGAWFLIFGLVLIFSPQPGSRPVSSRTRCINRLRNISLALENYHDKHGTFPPLWVVDEDGKPLYSWRVLMLPYLDLKPLYDLYNLDEPWDSPHNLQYSQLDIWAFKCPDNEHGSATTNYVAVRSKHGPWRGADPVSRDELTDMPEEAILLVEQHGEKIHWAEPKDLDLTTLPLHINDASGHGIGSLHSDGANVALLKNGRVEFLKDSLSGAELAKRLGGESGASH